MRDHAGVSDSSAVPPPAPAGVEQNGINVIAESERKGSPRDLFWPWFAANISVLGVSYGAFVLGFGVSFWQAVVAGVVGIAVSFTLCGLVALAGKRGSAPTMVLSRAAFGVRGNRLPSALSWLLTVGWETPRRRAASVMPIPPGWCRKSSRMSATRVADAVPDGGVDRSFVVLIVPPTGTPQVIPSECPRMPIDAR